MIEIFRRRKFQHGISQELQTFVVAVRRALPHRGAMDERLEQQVFVAEPDTDGLFEMDEGGRSSHAESSVGDLFGSWKRETLLVAR